MPRFYSPSLRSPDIGLTNTPSRIALDADVAQHVRVLRLQVGEVITLFGGDGRETKATIASIEKKFVEVDVQSCEWVNRESPLDIALVQSLAVADKMDWIVQKATELGVTEIVPMKANRATLKLDAERAEKRVAHWQAVAIAACEQCGRNVVPTVTAIQTMPETPLSMRSFRQSAQPRHYAILHPEADASLLAWARPFALAKEKLGILIGPEGGFDDRELALAKAAGVTMVRFGPRVLRTETAGIAALAALQSAFGDLG
jgi:16S rRNA (uracil1498-N3)-methyltransferase